MALIKHGCGKLTAEIKQTVDAKGKKTVASVDLKKKDK